MKRVLKGLVAVVIAVAIAVTGPFFVRAEARDVSFGPINAYGYIRTITISPELAENIFGNDSLTEINVMEDIFYLQMADNAYGFDYESFKWEKEKPDFKKRKYSSIFTTVHHLAEDGGPIGELASDIYMEIGFEYNDYIVYDYNDFETVYEDNGNTYYDLFSIGLIYAPDNLYVEIPFMFESQIYEMPASFVIEDSGVKDPVISESDRLYYPSWRSNYRIYRVWNEDTGEHYFTQDSDEKSAMLSEGWELETPMGYGEDELDYGIPVYRVYNPETRENVYTSDPREVKVLKKAGWKVTNGGNPIFYSPNPEHVEEVVDYSPVFRLLNPYASAFTNRHHYTSDIYEIEVLVETAGWELENEGYPLWYVYD